MTTAAIDDILAAPPAIASPVAGPIVRSFLSEVDDIKPGERAVIAKVNTRATDRYRTRINPDGISLDNYRKNPVVLFEHGKDVTRGALPVARNLWIKYDRGGDCLIAKTQFREDSYSEALWDAYRTGDLRAWSIRALPIEFGPPNHEEMRAWPEIANNCDVVFRHTDLLEYSCVVVGGNADTLSLLTARGIRVPDDADDARTMTAGGGVSSGGVTIKPGWVAEGPKAEEPKEDDAPIATVRARGNRPGGSDPTVGEWDDPDEFAKDPPPVGPGFGGTLEAPAVPFPMVGDSISEPSANEPGVSPGTAPDAPPVYPATPPPPRVNPIEPEDEPNADIQAPATQRYIKKVGSQYNIYSEKGKRLGTYKTKDQATKRLQQIEYFKHRDQGRAAPSGELGGPDVEVEPDAESIAEPVLPDSPDPLAPPVPAPPPLRSAPYIDTDGGTWHIRGIDGASLMRFDDARTAEQMLASQDVAPRRFDDVHADTMASVRFELAAFEDRMIGLMELMLLGKV